MWKHVVAFFIFINLETWLLYSNNQNRDTVAGNRLKSHDTIKISDWQCDSMSSLSVCLSLSLALFLFPFWTTLKNINKYRIMLIYEAISYRSSTSCVIRNIRKCIHICINVFFTSLKGIFCWLQCVCLLPKERLLFIPFESSYRQITGDGKRPTESKYAGMLPVREESKDTRRQSELREVPHGALWIILALVCVRRVGEAESMRKWLKM